MMDIDDVWIKGKELCIYIYICVYIYILQYMNNFGCVFDGLILTFFMQKLRG